MRIDFELGKKASVMAFAGLCLIAGGPSIALAGEESPSVDTAESNGNWLESIFDGVNRLDLEAETLDSDDVDIQRYGLQFEAQHLVWNYSLTLGYTDYELDYRPAVIGSDTDLAERSRSIQANLGVKLKGGWDLDFAARHYDGFAGYRSIWIAEYYRQVFGFFPGYIDPDPEGYSFSLGARYSYLSGHSVRLSVGYGRDTIAPGYSVGAVGLERSRPNLYRRSATLSFENVWTPWLKSQNRISYVDITSRDRRLSLSSTWHIALGEDWTLRVQGGYSEEDPEFEAVYGGVAIEWEFAEGWYISLNADLYSDTGEIPNAGLVSTAAPGVDTMQYGVGLRWVGENSAVRLFVAIYENDYEALSPGNQIFRNLYQDRDWTLIQLSYTCQF